MSDKTLAADSRTTDRHADCPEEAPHTESPLHLEPLPETVILAGDRPIRVDPRLNITPVSTKELFHTAVEDLRLGLFEPKHAAKAVPAYTVLSSLFLMRHDVNPNLPQETREENADLLPGAAEAALDAADTHPDASMMKLDKTKVRNGLGRVQTLNKLHTSVSWIGTAVRNNIAHTEKEVGGAIRLGIRRIGSLLEMDFTLREALGRTIRWIELPSKRAKQTKADREQVREETREQVLQEIKAADKADDTGKPQEPGPASTKDQGPKRTIPSASPVAPLRRKR